MRTLTRWGQRACSVIVLDARDAFPCGSIAPWSRARREHREVLGNVDATLHELQQFHLLCVLVGTEDDPQRKLLRGTFMLVEPPQVNPSGTCRPP